MLNKIILLLFGLMLMFSTLVYPMDSSEVMEYEGKIVNIELLVPTTTETVTVCNMEILGVFLHPEQIIPNYYVSIRFRYNDYKGKIFVLPCKYIVYMEEVK